MESYAKILKIYRNKIAVLKKRKRSGKMYFSYLICIAFAIITIASIDIRSNIIHIYNPVSSLYNDDSKAVFTFSNTKNLDFVLPVVGGVVDVSDGVISITIGESIMVSSVENGVVEKCGTSLDGIRYIKIKHSANIYSVISNVDIVGVSNGDVVKRGQKIATAKTGYIIKLELYDGDTIIDNLSVSHSKIIWEK